MTSGANSFTATRTPAWAVPNPAAGHHPRLFPSNFLSNFAANWANPPTASFSTLKSHWNSQSSASIGALVRFLGTGSATDLSNAVAYATGQSFNQICLEQELFCPASLLVYDLAFDSLSSAQKSSLVSDVNTDLPTRQSTLAASNSVFPFGENEEGSPAFYLGVLGILNDSGATNASSQLTNAMRHAQNLADWRDEMCAEGHGPAYGWEVANIAVDHAMLSCVFGAQSPHRMYRNRATYVAYNLMSNGVDQYAHPSDNRAGTSGAYILLSPEGAWQMLFLANVQGSALAQSIGKGMVNAGVFNLPTSTADTIRPTWTAFGNYVPGAPTQTPIQAALPTCNALMTNGIANFRGGWNSTTDLIARMFCGAAMVYDHDTQYAGHFEARVGDAMGICSLYNYAGRSSGWEVAPPFPTPNLPGNASYTKNTALFCISGSGTEDTSGIQSTTQPSNSTTKLPISASMGYPSWAGGQITSFTDNGTLALMQGDLNDAYNQVSAYTMKCGYVRGSTSSRGTFVIQDNFTANANVGNIRRIFGFRGKPSFNGTQSILSGSSSAGVLAITGGGANNGDAVWFEPNSVNGSPASRFTVQIVSPFVQIDLVGGAGFETYYNGYPGGGSDVDFAQNFQGGTGDNRNAPQYARIQGCWQARFRTTAATANGRMTYVVTVTPAGTAAASFNEAQANALLAGTGGATIWQGSAALGGVSGISSAAVLLNFADPATIIGGGALNCALPFTPVQLGGTASTASGSSFPIRVSAAAGSTIVLLVGSTANNAVFTGVTDTKNGSWNQATQSAASSGCPTAAVFYIQKSKALVAGIDTIIVTGATYKAIAYALPFGYAFDTGFSSGSNSATSNNLTLDSFAGFNELILACTNIGGSPGTFTEAPGFSAGDNPAGANFFGAFQQVSNGPTGAAQWLSESIYIASSLEIGRIGHIVPWGGDEFGYAYTFALDGSQPSGVTVDADTGMLSIGTPLAAGNYIFNVLVSNRAITSKVETFQITLNVLQGVSLIT